MENQAHHIQMLLADELDSYRGKENMYADEHIKEIQDTYKQEDQEMKKLVVNNKEKQQVQDKEVFLYKLYNISPSRPKLTFIQDKVNNLDKYMKYMQSLVTTTLFYPPPYYKSIQPQGEQDEQY